MYANLHTLPAHQHLYLVAVGEDEVEVITSSRATTAEVIAAAQPQLDDWYPGVPVTGLADQTDGTILWEA